MPDIENQSLRSIIAKNRFGLLLIVQLLMLVTFPVAELFSTPDSNRLFRLTVGIAFVSVIVAAVYAVSHSRRTRIVAVILSAPAIGLEMLDIGLPGPKVFITSTTLAIAFLLFAIIVILRFLFQSQRVTGNIVFASLCVYVLMGTIWALLFLLIENLLPGSFSVNTGNTVTSELAHFGGQKSATAFYFSFVTMTTLGYGDITPVSSLAKMMTVLQAVIGQLYLVVLVARLVGLHIAHTNIRRPGGD